MTDLYEIRDERFRTMVLPNARLETLGQGYAWLEGPVWFGDHHCLYVSDLPSDRLLRWTPASGIEECQRPAHFPNGHARDLQGRLISCSHGLRAVTRVELDGTFTVLAESYQGKPLNSPNDVVCSSDGSIWFTDPPYGGQTDYEGGKHACELPATLYRLDATGRLVVAAENIVGPNGLAFSPDERWLYVADTGENFATTPRACIRRFEVGNDRSLSGGEPPFHVVSPGMADGLRVDEEGNIWSSAADGVHCIAADGTLLGKVLTPSLVANVCFGDRHRSRLFICASHDLLAIWVNVRGAARP